MARGTTKRSVRIDDALWDEAQTVAAERGENLSEVLRDKLRAYITEARATRPS